MLNKLEIIGYVGRDAETRNVGTTKACTFSVATTEKWKDRSGEEKEHTEWHACEAWGKLADLAPYILKGGLVYVEGKIQTEVWKAKSGEERQSKKVRASRICLLRRAGQNQAAAAPAQPKPVEGGFVAEDDDIPF